MKFLGKLKIGPRLIAGFLIVCAVFTAVNVYSISNTMQIDKQSSQLYLQETEPIEMLAQVAQLYQRTRVIVRDIILMEDMDGKESEAENLLAKDEQINELLSKLEDSVNEEDKTFIADIRAGIQEYAPYRANVVELALANQPEEAYRNLQGKESDDAAMAVQDAINAMETKLVGEAEVQFASNNQLAQTTQLIAIICIIAALGIAVWLSLTISNGISKPIGKIKDAADKLADGNMDIRLDIKSKDETGTMALALAKVGDSITDLLSETNALSQNLIGGALNRRADESRFAGDYKKLVSGINKSVDVLAGTFEMLPSVLMFIDKDYRITYMNRTASEIFGKPNAEMLGLYCSDLWKTENCRTDACPCMISMEKDSIEHCDNECVLNGRHMDLDCISAPVKNENGEIIGAFELVTDQSGIKEAARKVEKQSRYQTEETNKLLVNLKRLSAGDLTCDMEVSAGDKDTEELRRLYGNISENLHAGVDSIKNYINEITQALKRMAEGNLTVPIDSEFHGDFAGLKESINHILTTMNELLSEINSAAEQVAAGSAQVSQENQAISQGATEQASSIEELTTTIGHIADQTKQNVENANQSKQAASGAKMVAEGANEQMQTMLKSMDDINESSQNISKIIKVIDDIAFQTNILALNAAVEAARAGAHGKGFAVVAEEVRNLAARSAKAAKETADIIEKSINQVESGTAIAGKTAEALSGIVQGATDAEKLEEKIVKASEEQAAGIMQVNQGIEQMSQVVQSNSASAEEGAAASEELSGQAELLKEKTGRFKLKKTSNGIKKEPDSKNLLESNLQEGPDKNEKY
jgi:methyl-accepting chemotaxis protein